MSVALVIDAVTSAGDNQHRGQRGCRVNSARGCTDGSRASYQPVKAISRALSVLRALNEIEHASVGELHRMTGIPKPTIVRALETLISEGYVVRDNFSQGYRTTSEVQALSRGFGGTPLIIEAARVWAIALTEQIKWPVSIGTVVDGNVVVNFCTAPISPYAFPFPTLNRPFPVTDTAIGRCYISFCSERERAELIRRHCDPIGDQKAELRHHMERTVAEIRERGYALQDPYVTARMFDEALRFQFLAVPIMNESECVACLGIGFYKRAVRLADLEETLVKPVRVTVAKIERNIEMLKRSAAAQQRL